jgi:hypothetical protein
MLNLAFSNKSVTVSKKALAESKVPITYVGEKDKNS